MKPPNVLIFCALLARCACAQTPVDPAKDPQLLAKARPLYDTPFRRKLSSVTCDVEFDFKKHLQSNNAHTPTELVPLIDPIAAVKYKVTVDKDDASVVPVAPTGFKSDSQAARFEESNRQLIRIGLSNWIPHAEGTLLPLGATRYHFDETAEGYTLTMKQNGLDAVLKLDKNLWLLGGHNTQPQLMDFTTQFSPGPDGLVLTVAGTDTNHAGLVRYDYSYQTVDGFQFPKQVILTAPWGARLTYALSGCNAKRVLEVKVGPPDLH